MNGMYRSACDQLYCLEEFNCCSMKPAEKPSGEVKESKASWWSSFDHKGWSKCTAGEYITGLYRSANRNPDAIYRLEMARCESAPLKWDPSGEQYCYKLNLWNSFDKKGWGKCKAGYYMQSIYRTREDDRFNDIQLFSCCKPKTKHIVQVNCQRHSVLQSFDKEGWSECPKGKCILVSDCH